MFLGVFIQTSCSEYLQIMLTWSQIIALVSCNNSWPPVSIKCCLREEMKLDVLKLLACLLTGGCSLSLYGAYVVALLMILVDKERSGCSVNNASMFSD